MYMTDFYSHETDILFRKQNFSIQYELGVAALLKLNYFKGIFRELLLQVT